MQAIEIYTPRKNERGEHVKASMHEAVLYDPEALVEPVRIVHALEEGGAAERREPVRNTSSACSTTIRSTGCTTPIPPGTTIEYTVPDIYGRPWARIWERYHEDGMEHPQRRSLCSGSSEEICMHRYSRACALQRSWRAAVVTLAVPAAAHHSFAMYDEKKTYVFTGVVTRISPDANHLQIFFSPY